MSINFPTLQSLTIPEGKVKQITDASGRVIWGRTEPVTSGPVILEVEKITSNTYAGETLYENEQFILLDIYPKTSGTVNVTYGGLTKTITDTSGAEEPNAQQVFFGTFNGVTDSVATPASGELTIKGECRGVAIGTFYKNDKGLPSYHACVTAITDLANIECIPTYAFYLCKKIVSATIPDGITIIERMAFTDCEGLTNIIFPNSLTTIESNAFLRCKGLQAITIPSGVTSIGESAFMSCESLGNVIVLATTPPTIDKSTFQYNTATITVPKGCGDIYKSTTNWRIYADYIVEAS